MLVIFAAGASATFLFAGRAGRSRIGTRFSSSGHGFIVDKM